MLLKVLTLTCIQDYFPIDSNIDADVGVGVSAYGIVAICKGELIVKIKQHVRTLPSF